MNLLYKRNNYENTIFTLLEIRENDITGNKIRGHSWRYKLPKHIPQLQPEISSQSRSLIDHICSNSNSYDQSIKCSCYLKENSCPKLVVENTEQIHLENLRRNLQNRLQIAQAKENYDLVAMLQKECQQLKLDCQVC